MVLLVVRYSKRLLCLFCNFNISYCKLFFARLAGIYQFQCVYSKCCELWANCLIMPTPAFLCKPVFAILHDKTLWHFKNSLLSFFEIIIFFQCLPYIVYAGIIILKIFVVKFRCCFTILTVSSSIFNSFCVQFKEYLKRV